MRVSACNFQIILHYENTSCCQTGASPRAIYKLQTALDRNVNIQIFLRIHLTINKTNWKTVGRLNNFRLHVLWLVSDLSDEKLIDYWNNFRLDVYYTTSHSDSDCPTQASPGSRPGPPGDATQRKLFGRKTIAFRGTETVRTDGLQILAIIWFR